MICQFNECHVDEIQSWWNAKLMDDMSSWLYTKFKCQVDYIPSLNAKLMKYQVDVMPVWWNACLMICEVNEVPSWWNVKLMKCQVDEMSSWWNAKLMKVKVDEMLIWLMPSSLNAYLINCLYNEMPI